MKETIDEKNTKTIVHALNELLANEYAFFTKNLNYHWNVTGPRFHSLHTFLEIHYRDLLETMDNIAERVRILGSTPLSTVKEMETSMVIKEKNGADMSANEMLDDLLKDSVLIEDFIKEKVAMDGLFDHDPGTEDFLIGILQKHEKFSWMLRSHLI